MKKEVKLKLGWQKVTFLSEFFKYLAELPNLIEDLELEHYVVCEFYESKLKTFTIIKNRTVTFKASQAVALARILQNIETEDGVTLVYRNDLIAQLHKHFPKLIKD